MSVAMLLNAMISLLLVGPSLWVRYRRARHHKGTNARPDDAGVGRTLLQVAAQGTSRAERERLLEEWGAELAVLWAETRKKRVCMAFAMPLVVRYGLLGLARSLAAGLSRRLPWRRREELLDLKIEASLEALTLLSDGKIREPCVAISVGCKGQWSLHIPGDEAQHAD